MIGQMAVRVTADRANFPLGALFVRRGSAANVALVGVPVRAGVDVESVTVRVENVDGEAADFAARQFGGVWVVDIPASHFTTVGSVTGGVAVFATGTGADGETERTWNVGVGDLEVLPADADAPAPTPGQTFWPLRMFDAAPTAPTKYNAYLDGSELKIWNGTAWITISGGSGGSVSWDDVTGKPTFATVATSGLYNDLEGKPTIPPAVTVDATLTNNGKNPVKSSGIWGAIWGALTALPTGFTALYDWVVAQLAGKLGTSGQQQLNGALIVYSGTSITVIEGSRIQNFAGAIAKEFSFPSASGTLAITAGTGHDGNIALLDDNGNPTDSQIPVAGIALSADLRYRIAEAGYATTGARLPEGVTVWVNGTKITGYYFLDFISGEWAFSVDGYGAFWDEDGSFLRKEDEVVFRDSEDTVLPTPPDLLVPRALADRTVNLITATDETSIDIELPAAVEEPTGVRRARDFILDVDNSANASDLALEFTALGVSYAFVPLEDDSISEMMTIGAGERVRLYFTETPYTTNGSLPVINVARVTLGDFVTSTTTTQGGN